MQNKKFFCHTTSKTANSFLLCYRVSFAALAVFLLPHFSAIAGPVKSKHPHDLQQLLTYEIAGISLSTPLKSIPEILEQHGYNQTGASTYTRQFQPSGQRKSIYRIEVDDSPEQRQITYFRGQSGGRVKNAALHEKPIQGDEIDMAKTLYQLVCADSSPQKQQKYECQPATDSLITFGNGELIEINQTVNAKLQVSAGSSTIAIKSFKK